MSRSIIKVVRAIFDRESAKKTEAEMERSLASAGEKGGKKSGDNFVRELRAAFDKRKAQLSEQLARGTIDQKEFKKQTDIAAKTFNTGLLKGIEEARRRGELTDREYIKLTRSIKRVGDEGGRSIGGRLVDAFKKAAVAAGAFFSIRALQRWVRGSVQAFGDFDQAMTRSLAIMGDVDEAMRVRMAKTARDVAKDLNLSAAEVAEGYFFLASAGLTAAQAVEALPQAATFAKAGAFDLATAVDLLTDAQSALGLTVDNTTQNLRNQTRVSDVLVKANTLANATVQQFSESLTSRAGAALRTFNKDIEEGVAVLAAYADQGTKGAEAGTNLSRIMRLLSTAAANKKKELAALNITLTDTAGNMLPLADQIESVTNGLAGMSDTQRQVALESIGFQARVQDAILPLLGTSDAIREYERELRIAGGTTQDVSDKQMVAFAEQWGRVQRKVEDLRIELGQKLAPVLIGVADNFDELVIAVVALTKALVVAGAITAVGKLVIALRAATLATQAWAFSIRSTLALIGPKGWFILGVASLTEWFRRQGKAARDAARDVDEWRESLKLMSLEELNNQLVELGKQRRTIQAQLEEFERKGRTRLAEDARRRLEAVRQGAFEVIGLINQIKAAQDAPDEPGFVPRPDALGGPEVDQKEIDRLKRLEEQREALIQQMARDIEIHGRRVQAYQEGEEAVEALNRQLHIEEAVLRSGAEAGSEFEATIRHLAAAQYDAAAASAEAAAQFESSWTNAAEAVEAQFQGLMASAGALFLSLATGGIQSVARLAKVKALENVAAAIENFARSKGWIALGNVPSAAAAGAAAKEHLLAAAKWGAVGGAAGMGGGGGAGPSVSAPRTQGAAQAAPQPITYVYIDPLDPHNPVYQRNVAATGQSGGERYGHNVRVRPHPGGGRS